MHRVLVVVLTLAASLRAFASDGHSTGNLPPHHVKDPQAPAVTEANLLSNERFWPYQVALLKAGFEGVLIRVDDNGVARIDFGRDGRREVRVSETDLLERANRIRVGELEKLAPNFVLALGPRLVDPGSESLRPYPFARVAEKSGFVCVFADPGAADFAKLAAGLAPLNERHGVTTILFPQGEHPDAKIRERLRALKWTVPFVYDHLSEPYSRSLLSTDVRLPAVILQTNEGRVLLESAWRADLVPELTLALDRAFGAAPAASAIVDRE